MVEFLPDDTKKNKLPTPALRLAAALVGYGYVKIYTKKNPSILLGRNKIQTKVSGVKVLCSSHIYISLSTLLPSRNSCINKIAAFLSIENDIPATATGKESF